MQVRNASFMIQCKFLVVIMVVVWESIGCKDDDVGDDDVHL